MWLRVSRLSEPIHYRMPGFLFAGTRTSSWSFYVAEHSDIESIRHLLGYPPDAHPNQAHRFLEELHTTLYSTYPPAWELRDTVWAGPLADFHFTAHCILGYACLHLASRHLSSRMPVTTWLLEHSISRIRDTSGSLSLGLEAPTSCTSCTLQSPKAVRVQCHLRSHSLCSSCTGSWFETSVATKLTTATLSVDSPVKCNGYTDCRM